MNDTFPHDTSGGAASANTVRGRSGSTVGPSGSHYIIGPLQKASGPRKKEKTAMSHFWDTHHSPDLGASLFQVLGVKGLQRQSSCANWSFDKGCPKSCFPHRGLHGGRLYVFIGKDVPFSSCTNCQHMSALVSVHLIGRRDRHLSKLQ